MKYPISKVFSLHFTTVFLLFAQHVSAGPWIDVGDERTRHHIQFLHDTGVINLPLTTWPLPWPDISRELAKIKLSDLSEAELWSYRYIKHTLENAKQGAESVKKIYGSNSVQPFTSFASLSRGKASATSTTAALLDNFAVNLEAHAILEPTGNYEYRLDGSYVAGAFGNWVVGAGAIDRWWGPGWHSSLILSNNARPTRGAFLRRKESTPSELPILSALGPWSFEVFASQLNRSRQISEAKLIGARITLAPIRALEIGVSRLGLWGGQSKLENLDAFADFVAFEDILVATDPEKKEASNQLISYDVRINKSFSGFSAAMYSQHLVNERQKSADAESATLAGLESAFHIKKIHNRVVLEYSDTRNKNDSFEAPGLNDLYDHAFFPEGYRYRGRNLGESAGTNALKWTLSGNHYFGNGHKLGWQLMQAEINADSSSNNFYDNETIEQLLTNVSYQLPINNQAMATVGVFFLDEKMELVEQDIESGAYLNIEIRL